MQQSYVAAHRPESLVGGLKPGMPCVCQANEAHCEMVDRTHKVFNVGKPQPKLSDVDDLKKALIDVGIL